MPLLGRGQTEGREESLRIHRLFPGHGELRVRKIEIPGREPVQLSHLGERLVLAARPHLEKPRVRVPQFFLHELLDRHRLRPIFAGHLRLAREFRDPRNGGGVAELIAVDRRAVTAAADGNLHAVAIIDLPVETVRVALRLFPGNVIGDEGGQKIHGERLVAGHGGKRPDGICGPEGIAAGIAALAEPEARVVIENFRIAQPAALVKVMARRATDGVEFPGPAHVRQELVHDEPGGRLLDVLPVGPPAEIISRRDLLVRAVEQRDVALQKIPRGRVGDRPLVEFVVLLVEVLDVMLEITGLEDERPGLRHGGPRAGNKRDQQRDEEEWFQSSGSVLRCCSPSPRPSPPRRGRCFGTLLSAGTCSEVAPPFPDSTRQSNA